MSNGFRERSSSGSLAMLAAMRRASSRGEFANLIKINGKVRRAGTIQSR
jgi:hypothetical protein